jgi:hypothetical protein
MHVNVQFESCSKQPHEERAFDLITITELAATCTRLAVVIRDGEVLESVELHHRLSPANRRELQEAKFETMDCLEYVLTGGGSSGIWASGRLLNLKAKNGMNSVLGRVLANSNVLLITKIAQGLFF